MLDPINTFARNLLLPPTSLFLLILVGLALWRPWPRLGRLVAGTNLAALAFLSSTLGAGLLVAPLERQSEPLRQPERAGAQAIVVLSAGRLRDAPEYGDRDIPDYVALARLRYAAHLQRRTGLPVLVSGGHAGRRTAPDARSRAYTLADAMATALRGDFGVPVRWIESRSRDTGENAAFSAALLRKDGVTRILLVTDAMHMPRARAVFERAGLQVTAAPTMFLSRQAPGPWSWLPSAEGMRRSWYATYEMMGNARDRMRG